MRKRSARKHLKHLHAGDEQNSIFFVVGGTVTSRRCRAVGYLAIYIAISYLVLVVRELIESWGISVTAAY